MRRAILSLSRPFSTRKDSAIEKSKPRSSLLASIFDEVDRELLHFDKVFGWNGLRFDSHSTFWVATQAEQS